MRTLGWSITGYMNDARQYHTSSILPNGNVLVAGGQGYRMTLSSSEIYDPSTGVWSLTDDIKYTRYLHTAIVVLDGKVLVMGGHTLRGYSNSAELYDLSTGV